MKPLWPRLLRHALMTGVALAIIGHLLARGFLHSHRLYGGGAYNPENERVLWQTPLVMAAIGIMLTAGMDVLVHLARRPTKMTPTDTPANA